MGNTGFDVAFTINRKRNLYSIPFLMYLHGEDSAAGEWIDREDTNVDPTNADGVTLPFGYSERDGGVQTGNLGVDAETITKFTIGAVVVRDEMANNDSVFYGLFGSTHYPRLFFTGTTLKAQIKLDGNVKEVSIANVGTYMKPGQPHFVVFRGTASAGIEVLIDGVVRGTQTDTGTAYDVGSGDFSIGYDSNNSYVFAGSLRGLFVTARSLSDMQLSLWRDMLEYEGVFAVWKDNFEKWTGAEVFTFGLHQVGDSPYSVTLIES